jgi:hypothetical protein
MVRCNAGTLTVLSFVIAVAMTPAAAGDTLDLSIPSDPAHPSPPMTLSLGSFGVRSDASDPYRAEQSDVRNHFEIPSERPAAGGAGFLVRIPLDEVQSR